MGGGGRGGQVGREWSVLPDAAGGQSGGQKFGVGSISMEVFGDLDKSSLG